MSAWIKAIIIVTVLYCQCSFSEIASSRETINLSHLNSLRSQVTVEGRKLSIWAIYAEPVNPRKLEGPYRQVADEDEGISCVDDVARVAVVYLANFEQAGDKESLENSKAALDFVMAMQTDDGLFYNFVFPDGRINKEGETSRPSLGFWTMRGLWALTAGYRVFSKEDPEYARLLRKHIGRTLTRIDPSSPGSSLSEYGMFKTIGSIKSPKWLLNESTDETALAVIALCNLYETDGDERTREMIAKLAEGIVTAQEKDPPFCYFPSWLPAPRVWHAWGSRQMMALASAGRLLSHSEWISSAEREANNFIIHLLTSKGLIFGMGPAPELYPAQPYGAEVLVSGLIELYKATGKRNYAIMAGLMGSWFFGNNTARKPVYDEKSGRVFDGIDGQKLNTNSGAEATVSGLIALLRLREGGDLSARYLDFREIQESSFEVIEAEAEAFPAQNTHTICSKGESEGRYSGSGCVELKDGGRLTIPFQIDDAGDYIPWLVYSMEEKSILGISFDGNPSITLEKNTGGFLTLEKLPATLEGRRDHTMSLRFQGNKAHIDALIVQKSVEERVFMNSHGELLTIFKNVDNRERTEWKRLKKQIGKSDIYDKSGNLTQERLISTPGCEITLPPHGYCFLEEYQTE